MFYLNYGFSVFVMLLAPWGLIWSFCRVWHVPPSLAAWGAVTFIGFKAFNILGLGLVQLVLFLGFPKFAGPGLVDSVIRGILSGIFEEGGRWLTLAVLLTDHRSSREGVVYGLGWGGIEAFPMGIAVFAESLAVAGSGIQPVPAYAPLIPGMERFAALTMHVLNTLLVLKAVNERKLLYLLLAILIHSGINTVAGVVSPWFMSKEGAIISYPRALLFETCLLLFSIPMLIGITALARSRPA